MALIPEIIFDAFLRRIRPEVFNMPPKSIHRLFYAASRTHQKEMASFNFLLRTEPYSPTLARLIWEFQQANQLGRMNPDYTGYVVKAEGEAMQLEDEKATKKVVNTLLELVEKGMTCVT